MLPYLRAYTRVLTHIICFQLFRALVFTLDNRRSMWKVVLEEGLSLASPLPDPSRGCRINSTRSLPPDSRLFLTSSWLPFCSRSLSQSSSSDGSIPNLTFELREPSHLSSVLSISNPSSVTEINSRPFQQKMSLSSIATVALHPGHMSLQS